ncbi:type VI secretion system baseplate subunit TssG [Vibrio lentus]|nr:type VI secretion system baseplate subunit TssG [Vibrio lentus]
MEEISILLVGGLMRFILRDFMSWDLKLTVDLDSVPKNQLGQGSGTSLGQTFWLSQAGTKDAKITGNWRHLKSRS